MLKLLPLLLLTSTPALAGLRVVGGNPADAGEWPDAVAVKLQGFYQCTGTLVAPRVVLTAGHCNLNITEVLVNSNDYAAPGSGEVIRVVAAYEYPNSWQTYDVAVLVLERDASVPPRTVATSCIIENHLFDGATVAPVGFGSTESWGGGGNSLLMEARTVVTDHDCSGNRRGCVDAVRPDGELIAGGDGIDSCNGDSGGPLYLETPDGWFLVGITSRAAEPASVACGDGGIYVRPDAIIDWAEAQTGLAIARPDCDTVSPSENRPPAPGEVALDVESGASGSVQIDPNDPDAGQTHSFVISAQPGVGSASVSTTGLVTYTAPADYVGSTSMAVQVTDDGSPVESGTATVRITVREATTPQDSGDPSADTGSRPDSGDPGSGTGEEIELSPGGCSCTATPASSAWILFAALPVVRRRR